MSIKNNKIFVISIIKLDMILTASSAKINGVGVTLDIQYLLVWYVLMIKWHKKVLEYFQVKLNLSNYSMLWVAFFEGVFVTMLIVWCVNY